MPTGIRPRVNEAREFLEIAKDFKDPKELMREALSNSWDAGATTVTLNFDFVPVPGTRKIRIRAEIIDDGEGMSTVPRQGIPTSEIEDFFNLGDSHKVSGSIGTKGHGTKIYYKSGGIHVDTWKNGTHVHAETEVPPWETLRRGIIPTYRYHEDNSPGKGTRIVVDAFEARQADFLNIVSLYEYIVWFTVAGSFGNYFGHERRMDIQLKPPALPTTLSFPFGFTFPEENTDISAGTDSYCKLFGPTTIDCGYTEEGKQVTVNLIGAVLGDSKRSFVPHTYEMMGLWLCKDFMRIERDNKPLEEVFGGQYFYRSMLIFANCQQFDLTANRNDMRREGEEFDLALHGMKEFIDGIKNDPDTTTYFSTKRNEEAGKALEKHVKDQHAQQEQITQKLAQRLNEYKARPDLNAPTVTDAPIKEPRSEAEVALLLQAMISSHHRSIDFRIGEYKTSVGTDLLVEYSGKGIPSYAWAELVLTLEKLFEWAHPPEGIHKVICWELGKVREEQTPSLWPKVRFNKLQAGRYQLLIGADSIDVYVLRELLQAH